MVAIKILAVGKMLLKYSLKLLNILKLSLAEMFLILHVILIFIILV